MKKFTLKMCMLILTLSVGWSNVQSQSIAFIGQGSTYNTLVTDQDGFAYEDDRAASVWFMDVFLPAHPSISGSYFSFQDVGEGADISGFDVLWIQADGATYPDRMNEWPRGTEDGGTRHCVIEESGFQWDNNCFVLEDAFIFNHIRPFYENGGNILLGNFAGKAMEVIGTFDGLSNPWEYRPNQVFGDVTANAANTPQAWGTNWSGSASSALISGITTANATCDFANLSIEFLTAGTEKKNRACQYNLDFGRIFDDAGGAGSTMTQRRAMFQNTLNAEILLENCSGNEIQGAQFNPINSGDGTIICYGAGVYDWYAPGTGNNDNVKLLTENTLLYLANGALSTNDFDVKQIVLHPNPASNIIIVETEKQLNLDVFDITGKLIYKGNSQNNIDCSAWKQGIYFVTMTDSQNQFSITKKIIKH